MPMNARRRRTRPASARRARGREPKAFTVPFYQRTRAPVPGEARSVRWLYHLPLCGGAAACVRHTIDTGEAQLRDARWRTSGDHHVEPTRTRHPDHGPIAGHAVTRLHVVAGRSGRLARNPPAGPVGPRVERSDVRPVPEVPPRPLAPDAPGRGAWSVLPLRLPRLVPSTARGPRTTARGADPQRRRRDAVRRHRGRGHDGRRSPRVARPVRPSPRRLRVRRSAWPRTASGSAWSPPGTACRSCETSTPSRRCGGRRTRTRTRTRTQEWT